MDDIKYGYLFINAKDPDDTKKLDEIAKELKEATGLTPVLAYETAKDTENVRNIVNYIFMVTIAIMMFLSFFSLSASMSANLYDQSKEIGIMRSIGVTKCRINLLYFYEALILVFASSFLGIVVGTFVAWTMKLQMDMFLDMSTDFFFPWLSTIEIFGLSILCAFFSTFGPTTELTRRQIAAIFRSA